MKITYLFHSSFAVQTGEYTLIFDYYKDTPKTGGLAAGVIDPNEIKDSKVLVFASHAHGDHFSPCIFSWRESIQGITYILSDDIKTKKSCHFIGANQSLTLGDVEIHTLKSNDEGVAFVVKLPNCTIYHGGDLNWWHWEGESESYNSAMAKSYKEQIELIADLHIDVAFVPIDYRLGESYLLGASYFMQKVNPDALIPMHTTDDHVFDMLENDSTAQSYRSKLIPLKKRGQFVSLPLNKTMPVQPNSDGIYIDADTGQRIHTKPEGMTHLRGNLLVPKTHPVIALRGKLDSLQSAILETQIVSQRHGNEAVCSELNQLLEFVRSMVSAQVRDTPMKEQSLLGLSSEDQRRISHNVKSELGIEHPVPSFEMGELAVSLNSLRTFARETELVALGCFVGSDPLGICLGLNRMSSCVYIIFCRLVKEQRDYKNRDTAQ